MIPSSVRLAGYRALWASILLLAAPLLSASASVSLAPPSVGDRSLQVIAPTILEVAVITAGAEKPPKSGPAPEFPVPELKPADFHVTVAGRGQAIATVGFRRRPVYAPLKQRDLRIGNYVYLQLAEALPDGAAVEVIYRSAASEKVEWLAGEPFRASAEPLRLSPAIHVNQVGYVPSSLKLASIGYFLGSLGELELDASAKRAFQLVSAKDGKVVHQGELRPRADKFMPHRWYSNVWEADFSDFTTPGEYRLAVPGLGASYPFFIDEGVAAGFARTFALGLYHQRCGCDNASPFTRFTHAACHTAPASIPTGAARNLKGFENRADDADLFPIVRRGEVDVAGGHHDAGDYSKYTINSANFIHSLIFGIDTFEGAAALDNLGLPESGDGVGDLLQIAKWEADFLVKMQDEDGGFHFLVYPKTRRYEDNVLPDKGDPQIVWPKNSASTAAGVAALAQAASSPTFKKQYPKEAAAYLAAATKGWEFIQKAQRDHPKGFYRKFTHYGDMFEDKDDLVWAAVEIYLATGDTAAEKHLQSHLNPHNSATRRWGWWRMSESYGRAIRSYAFGARTQRVAKDKIDALLVTRCEQEILACAEDWTRAVRDSSYMVSYPEQTKRGGGGGWFFPLDYAYDIAVAAQLDFPERADRRPIYREAIIGNLNYVAGNNPANVSYLTGLGWKRPTDVVHQYGQNDQRVLPPTGIPLGTIQEGFYYMDNYRSELGALCYPLDGAKSSPYPVLDRWGDSFNLQTEFVAVNQARALAVTAWLAASTATSKQAWKPAVGSIQGSANATVGKPLTLRFVSPATDLDLAQARIVWDGRDQAPAIGSEFTFTPRQAGTQWIEAEAQWPDGRRVIATARFEASSGAGVTSAQR